MFLYLVILFYRLLLFLCPTICFSHGEERLKFYFLAVPRLFTTKIADYYEEYYKGKGVKFIKGTVLTSFEFDSSGKVNSGAYFVILRNTLLLSYPSESLRTNPLQITCTGYGC